ncbi:MAG: stage V sporulation protein AE [Thermincola sp.]|nr:stage V sporulation protein AE [Thermincola sp.]MDT3703704.1 stage V sporulation protein AE [Thermincola sp.]
MPDARRKVIIITDGDRVAGRTVKIAAKNVGARVISLTTGNPTPISGRKVVELIKQAPTDPVIIMVDDKGTCGFGKGEQVLEYVAKHPDICVIGAVAVASNTSGTEGIKVDESVTRDCAIVKGPVDKLGNPEKRGNKFLEGDTVDILRQLNIPVVIGTGDTGKMEFADDCSRGAPITTKALLEIISRSECNGTNNQHHI